MQTDEVHLEPIKKQQSSFLTIAALELLFADAFNMNKAHFSDALV